MDKIGESPLAPKGGMDKIGESPLAPGGGIAKIVEVVWVGFLRNDKIGERPFSPQRGNGQDCRSSLHGVCFFIFYAVVMD